ncbi:NADH:flavin oxidoreductase [Clostridium sp. MF28]|uniref:NAD(P)/FAD-dependent oxidoreductase n=1 Tax=Clostridium TaxID=1485 RepID=UPI000CF93CEC|nr:MULTISPECIES: NAD(P)/FAD-dependent oxidoreductase [Clostridium]AVK49359.1 NADH:flavin oxidoreductase [Clostridium sp. MF28]PSM58027.1 NADH:flavin oxidoreductase [Clostridium diolis]
MFKCVLSPHKIGKLELQNRFVMPGMGVNENGTVDEVTVAWYAARAKGGFGLIITEFFAVDSLGKAVPGEIVLDNDDIIPMLSKLPEEVHNYGTKIFMQIHHAGRETNSLVINGQPVSASAIPCPVNRELPRELTTEEVYELIEKFGDTALRAKKAGFDGVEIHAGHGYLPTQFMSAYVNRRTDEFGGDITGRAKFGVDIVKNIKKKCGDDFPVCMRLSGDELVDSGRRLSETVILAKLLEAAGVDAFNISTGVYATPEFMVAPYPADLGFNISAAEAIKKAVNIPIISVGRLNDPILMDTAIEDGLCDFVALGRTSIADAEFPNKVKEGVIDEISPCVGCNTRCQGSSGYDPSKSGISCAFNPLSGHETTMKIKKSDSPKTVVVVGGGVGGLETAWVAAACGHKVTLLEKSDKLGGQIVYGCVPPKKVELSRAVKYYITMCKKYGVDIKMNFEATKENIKTFNPDAVVLATGAKPIQPNIKNDGIPVVQALDILGGKVQAGNRVLVIGGGLVGLETAEFLASQLRQSTVVEMMDEVGKEIGQSVKFFLLKALQENNIEIITGAKVEKFTTDGAICSKNNEEIKLTGYDMVVLAMGTKSYNPLEEELRNQVKELYLIGDAAPGRAKSIAAAVDAGAHVALNL